MSSIYSNNFSFFDKKKFKNSFFKTKSPGFFLLDKFLQKGSPLKQKVFQKVEKSGRNQSGKIVISHRFGCFHKSSFRKTDCFSKFHFAIIQKIEEDPNRFSKIIRLFSLLSKRHFYLLAPDKLTEGSFIKRKNSFFLSVGGLAPLKSMPLGIQLHCLGSPLRMYKSVLQKASGSFGQLLERSSQTDSCVIRLKSGQQIFLSLKTLAVVGSVSCKLQRPYKNVGKAGFNNIIGIRPTTRGVAMNPFDHPHGGGEGRSSGGRPSVTPWSKPAHNKKTKKI